VLPTPRKSGSRGSKLDYLKVYANLECKALMTAPITPKIGVCIQLNCTKKGKVVPCKVSLFSMDHPDQEEPILVAIYEQISTRTSIKDIVLAACTGAFFKLVKEHKKISEEELSIQDMTMALASVTLATTTSSKASGPKRVLADGSSLAFSHSDSTVASDQAAGGDDTLHAEKAGNGSQESHLDLSQSQERNLDPPQNADEKQDVNEPGE